MERANKIPMASKERASQANTLFGFPSRNGRRKRGEFPPGTNTLNSPEHRILAAVFAVILNQYPDQIWQHSGKYLLSASTPM